MLVPVKLEDCEFKVVRSYPESLDNLEIRMGLSKSIDLTGIKFVQNHPSDHYRYNNQFGSFYIHCGDHASFSSSTTIKEQRNLEFESIYRFTDRFSAFRIWDSYDNNRQLEEGMQVSEIIKLIKSSKGFELYLESFFEWLNEFRNEYGDENHFNLPTQSL